MSNIIEMTGVRVVADKGSKLELALGVGVWSGWHLPYFDLATQSDSKVATRGREGERCHLGSEREVVDRDSAWYVCQNGLSIVVNGEKEVALRRETDASNVLAVGKGQSVRFVPISC